MHVGPAELALGAGQVIAAAAVVHALTVAGGAVAGWLRQDRVIGEIAVGLLVAPAARGWRSRRAPPKAGAGAVQPAVVAAIDRRLVGRGRGRRVGRDDPQCRDPRPDAADDGRQARTMLHALVTTDAL
jgi:hypothetical protein